MQFAMVNEDRRVAEPGLKGVCPVCASPVIAKCGTQKIWHWAHKGERSCDPWWEPETVWHRTWKNQFPTDWQEVVGHDESAEKHIADVRTPHGLVIEFQYSHLHPIERTTRERYYGNMVWVVDGTRLKRDYPRFQKGIVGASMTPLAGVMQTYFPEECFPRDWLDSGVPVLFDFGEVPADEVGHNDRRETLWCLLPGRIEQGYALLGRFPRAKFIELATKQSQIVDAASILSVLAEYYRLAREAELRRQYAEAKFYRQRRARRSWRF